MEHRFKAGDKVRCINNLMQQDFLTIGGIYTIVRPVYGYSKPRVILAGILEIHPYEDRFEPASRLITEL